MFPSSQQPQSAVRRQHRQALLAAFPFLHVHARSAEGGAGNSAVIIAVVVSLCCIAAIVAAAFVLQRKRKQHARTQVDLALCCVETRVL